MFYAIIIKVFSDFFLHFFKFFLQKSIFNVTILF